MVGRDAEIRRLADLVGLQRRNHPLELDGADGADHRDRVRERPGLRTGVELGDLGIDRGDVGTAQEADEHVAKGVDPGVRHQVAADGAEVVVAVEEPLDGYERRLRLGRELTLQRSTFGGVGLSTAIVPRARRAEEGKSPVRTRRGEPRLTVTRW
jgi:hypothetical protein